MASSLSPVGGGEGRKREREDIKISLYPSCQPPPRLLATVGKPRGKPSAPYPTTPEPRKAQNGRRQGLRGQGHRSRPLGPHRDRDRRDRDAGPDGDPRRVRQGAAAQGRARRRLAAHDDPDRRADRNAKGARRRRALGLVQHLLDPGPRRRGHRRRRHAGVRGQGRVAERVLGLYPQDLRMGRRRHAQHDPRRRRRRHAPHPSRRPRREGRREIPRGGRQRGRGSAVRRYQRAAEEQARLVRAERQDHPRRHRGDHHRRAPALRDAEEGHSVVAGDRRQQLGDQIEVRQSLRLPRVAGRRHPPRHRRDDGGQGRLCRGLRRRGQGLGRKLTPGRLPRARGRGRSDLRAASGDGRLRGHHHGGRGTARRHLRHGHRQRGRDHRRPHART